MLRDLHFTGPWLRQSRRLIGKWNGSLRQSPHEPAHPRERLSLNGQVRLEVQSIGTGDAAQVLLAFVCVSKAWRIHPHWSHLPRCGKGQTLNKKNSQHIVHKSHTVMHKPGSCGIVARLLCQKAAFQTAPQQHTASPSANMWFQFSLRKYTSKEGSAIPNRSKNGSSKKACLQRVRE